MSGRMRTRYARFSLPMAEESRTAKAAVRATCLAGADDRHREKRLPVPPASKPDGRISRIRLSSRWFYLEEE